MVWVDWLVSSFVCIISCPGSCTHFELLAREVRRAQDGGGGFLVERVHEGEGVALAGVGVGLWASGSSWIAHCVWCPTHCSLLRLSLIGSLIYMGRQSDFQHRFDMASVWFDNDDVLLSCECRVCPTLQCGTLERGDYLAWRWSLASLQHWALGGWHCRRREWL
jgi:hypothetical protein